MNTIVAAPESPVRELAPARHAPRVDLYRAIHKALRLSMTDAMNRVGRLDPLDGDDIEGGLAQLGEMLDFCAIHVQHENEFVHTAIEARQPAGSRRIAGEHDEHLDSIAALRLEAAALRDARAGDAPEHALCLYRHLALFVAENLQHMHIEETVHNAILWSCYSDAELLDVHRRLVASLSPQASLESLRRMLPACDPAERAAIIGGARMQMPPEALLAVLAMVKPHLDAAGWTKLTAAAGVDAAIGFAGAIIHDTGTGRNA